MTLLLLYIWSDWGVIAFSLLNYGNWVGPLGGTVLEALVCSLGNVEWLEVMRDREAALRYRAVHLVKSF